MRALRTFVLAAVVLLTAGLLLPRAAGGASEYVRTYGNSMEPSFQAGDLAVLRSAPQYEVGDVAAYHSAELEQVVLHRIVERDGDAFVFQGDNNDFRDGERITSQQVIGRLALRIPRGGMALSWLEHPLRASLVAIAISVLPAMWAHRRRRRRRQDPTSTRGNPMKSFNFAQFHRATPWLAAAASVLLLIGVMALTRPASTMIDNEAAATQTGRFTYSASSSSSLYPKGFTTGDPVFTRLADRVIVVFEHRMDGEWVVAEGSTVRLEAVISGAGGWKRTLPLIGARPLEQRETTVRATLDLPLLDALGKDAAAITGTPAGQIQVDVTAVVFLPGSSSATDQFVPKLGFSLDGAALRPTNPPAPTAAAVVESREVATSGSVPQAALMPMSFLGRQLEVGQATIFGLAGGGILMSLAVALASVGFLRKDHSASIASRYGNLVLPVRRVSEDPSRRVVDVSSMADLVRVARHHDQLVLRRTNEEGDVYLVELPATTYRYGIYSRGKPAAAAHSSAAGSEPASPVRV